MGGGPHLVNARSADAGAASDTSTTPDAGTTADAGATADAGSTRGAHLNLLGGLVPLDRGVSTGWVRRLAMRRTPGRNDNLLDKLEKLLSSQSCWATLALKGF